MSFSINLRTRLAAALGSESLARALETAIIANTSASAEVLRHLQIGCGNAQRGDRVMAAPKSYVDASTSAAAIVTKTSAVSDAQADVDASQSAVDDAQTALDGAPNDLGLQSDLADAQAQLAADQAVLAAAQLALARERHVLGLAQAANLNQKDRDMIVVMLAQDIPASQELIAAIVA